MLNLNKKQKNKKIGLALSGGAAFGLSHIGVLKYLEEINIKPDVISGTSIGSVIGGLYAAGFSIKQIEKIALSFSNKTKILSLLSFAFQKTGVISHANIEKFFRKYLKNIKIEDMKIKFIAVTVDLIHGNVLFINEGDLVDAIQASISIPGIFNPFEANGTLFIDGGVRENLPLTPLHRYKVDSVIAIDVLKPNSTYNDDTFSKIDSSQKYLLKTKLNIFEKLGDAFKQRTFPKFSSDIPDITTVGLQSLNYLIDENSINNQKLYKPDIVININFKKFKLWEFWRAEEFIQIGYKTAKTYFENSK